MLDPSCDLIFFLFFPNPKDPRFCTEKEVLLRQLLPLVRSMSNAVKIYTQIDWRF